MKQVKFLFSTVAIAALGLTLTMTSCNKDEVCPDGMEGKDCATEVRAKFLGTYSASDVRTKDGTTYTYSATIAKSPTVITQVLIGNFSDGYFTNDVIAGTLSGNSLTIAVQEPDGDGYKVSGSGTLSGNTLTVNYTVVQPVTGATQDYTGTWTK